MRLKCRQKFKCKRTDLVIMKSGPGRFESHVHIR